MPTILREKGYRFFFYSNEHLPRHIHVSGKDGEIKVELDSLKLVYNFNMKEKDVGKILEIINKKRFVFVREWDEFHNQ